MSLPLESCELSLNVSWNDDEFGDYALITMTCVALPQVKILAAWYFATHP